MKLILTITFLLSYLAISKGEAHYFIGTQGLSCNQVCYNELKNCNPKIETNDNTLLFAQLGVKCTPDTVPWISQDQPCYVSDPTDPSYGKCLGFVGVPDAGQCSGSHPSVQRLCRCDDPEDSASTFGLGYSSGMITPEENWIFQHYVTPGNVGVLTHFWITYLSKVDNGTIVRYYIDGEHEASIQFTPSLACGVGFYDDYAPWGNDWFGKGAKDGGWFNKFRIPFHKSIVVTVQHLYGSYDGFYMILRGSLNAPIYIDGKPLPATAKMNQVRIEKTFQVADWIPLINESKGPGAVFMVTLAAESENLNFLEGCIHAYFDGKNEFPGVVLATGTEDYFDSAWYYNAGRYYQPTSGLTHFIEKPGSVTWSSYRFHDKDPLYWKDGFQLIWRNGDLDDKTGMKCHTISKGRVHDHPTASKVYAYAWYYTWPEEKTA